MSAMQDSAAKWTLAVSISESPDIEVLGLFPGDDRRLLGTILTPLVYRGARIAYGGRIKPRADTNFTQEIAMQLAEAYRRRGEDYGSRPCIHYLRDSDAYREGADGLMQHALRLGSYSEIKLLRGDTTVATLVPSGMSVDVLADGDPVNVKITDELVRQPPIAAVFAKAPEDDGLAGMRSAMARETSARIILGGRVSGMTKGISGIVAEAMATLKAQKPLLVLGSVGGASRDVAWKLGLIDNGEQVDRDESAYRDSQDQPCAKSYRDQLDELATFASAYKAGLDSQGLFANARRLALSESHTEIESLVLGMLSKMLPS